MNLYDIHPDPESAPYRDWAYENVPELVYRRHWGNHEELRRREPALARDPRYAYWYALDVLRRPFPAGEPAIAGDPIYAYLYALNVLGLSRGEAEAWTPRRAPDR